METAGDASARARPGKKMGKRERAKARARALELGGMSRADARAACGLGATPAPAAKKTTTTTATTTTGGARRGRGTSPALLTANVKHARSLREVYALRDESAGRMNHIHLSAVWTSVGRMRCEGERASSSDRDETREAHERLIAHTIEFVRDERSKMGGRELANVAHGAAKGGGSEELFAALAKAIERHLGGIDRGQELANIAWAFAKADYKSERLFSALARMAERHAERFNSQELTNTCWAFASVGHADARLFKALARCVERRLGEFNTQGLSNTAWGFAKSGFVDVGLFRAMSQKAQERLDDFNAQDFSNLIYAFAKAGQYDAKLFTTLAKHAERHLGALNAQGLTNTVWSFSKCGHLDAELFSKFGQSIERRMTANASEFNSQDIANTAWAFGKACHHDEKLFTSLASLSERCLADFNTQDLVNTTWAFAKLGRYDAKLFVAARKSILDHRLNDLDAPNIANIVWTFDQASQLSEALFVALASAAEHQADNFNAQDLVNVAWTFANSGQVNDALFTALARSVKRLMDEFSDEELNNLEWAFTTAGQQSVVKHLKQQRHGANNENHGPPVDVSKCGRVIIAGGGIGGAAAAVALQSKGFDVVVLESDKSFDARAQGYGLTVQAQDAIQAMGVDISQDDAPSTSHYTFDAEGHIIGFFGEAFGAKSRERREVQNSGRFIHIPRQVLRSRIIEAVQPGTIRWNSKLKSFVARENGVSVTLTDGTELDGALLVGSDGIFSTVRRHLDLPGDRLNYVGLCVVLGIVDEKIMNVPLAHRRIFETVDGATRLYAMPFTTTSTMWQLSFPCSEETARQYTKDATTLKEEIVRRCAQWHDPVPDLLRNTPLDCMSGYPVYDRELLDPVLLRPTDESKRRVTLIGDAAHPMTPFKAQGANQAMSDAVLLADTLVDGVRRHGPNSGFDFALPIFEQKMLSRSSRMVVGSREKAKEMHSPLALQPARKAQREAEFDMQKTLRVLREKGIGAQNASDPKGLDNLIETEAISSPLDSTSDHTAIDWMEHGGGDSQGKKVVFEDSDVDEDADLVKDKKRKAHELKKEKKAKKAKKERRKRRKRRRKRTGRSPSCNKISCCTLMS